MSLNPSLDRIARFLVNCAIASGIALLIDSVVLDTLLDGSIPAKVAGLVSLLLGILGVVGIYLVAQARRQCQHLDAGFLLNVVGLAGLVGISFARNFVLTELDDDVVDALVESGPTLPALIATGVFASIGFVLFGTALARHRFDPPGAWAYAVLVPVGGFAAQLPNAVAAVVQALGALAIIRLGWSAREYHRTASSFKHVPGGRSTDRVVPE